MKPNEYDVNGGVRVIPSSRLWGNRETSISNSAARSDNKYAKLEYKWEAWWKFDGNVGSFRFGIRDCIPGELRTRKGLYLHLWSKIALGIVHRPDCHLWLEIHIDGALGAEANMQGTPMYSADTEGGQENMFHCRHNAGSTVMGGCKLQQGGARWWSMYRLLPDGGCPGRLLLLV